MKSINRLLMTGLLPIILSSCSYIEQMQERAKEINHYEKVALNLSKQNRELQVDIDKLNYEIQILKSKNSFLTLQLEKQQRGPGSADRDVKLMPVDDQDDMVNYPIYRWPAQQLLVVAEEEFDKKNFEKSAQFFQTFLQTYPKHDKINDLLLFKAGTAAYESGKYHEWTLQALGRLLDDYPTSNFYRGAKLWIALTNLKLGKKDQFFNTVEEFRKKYRNTPEWKILSSYYEEIVQKYKKDE